MKPSLFSVSYAGMWGQAVLSLPNFIARAGRLGFPSVMLMGKRPHLSPLDATSSFVESLRDTLAAAQVCCDVVAGYTHLAPGVAAEVPVIEFEIAYVESLARLAAQLGASVVRIFTAYQSEGQDPQAHWRRVVAAVQEMCDRAAAHGVTIAIQNHHDLAVHTDALLELLADIDRPNCKLGFDAWSPALRGENLYDAARLAASHTAITTNADYVRVPRYRYRTDLVNYERLAPDWVRAVPFGTGFIDYPAFFKGLRDGGFNGLAVYEMCSPVRGGGALENLDTCATAYLKWMQAHQLTETAEGA
ncbi:MAG: sugar phosphate isomerase/epimerase [Planctomycetes bacterium]|nr:sugar phosphate isomerase/epimerase [Planctomycetota bacterium]